MIPKRRKPPKMGISEPSQIRCPSHLKWVRGHDCAVCGTLRSIYPIEAAHVRTGTDGGMGVKPSDCWAIPLCSHHHRDQHLIGEAEFERIHDINMKSIAQALWAKSPHKPRPRVKMCEQCGVHPADVKRQGEWICPGCDAYRDHQS